ncbi:MAG: MarR family transcriptional regulator [Acidobacteria bacterium]|nr:MAG: MarR family transcriptional regulator [Acidobacteriota bacterium]
MPALHRHRIGSIQPANPGRIAAELGLTGGAVTVMVGRLERAGFVRRGDDPGDRRKVIVELTDQAREVLDRIWGPIAADLQAIAARFTIAELETLERLFDASAGLNARHMERVAELDLILPRERRDG